MTIPFPAKYGEGMKSECEGNQCCLADVTAVFQEDKSTSKTGHCGFYGCHLGSMVYFPRVVRIIQQNLLQCLQACEKSKIIFS